MLPNKKSSNHIATWGGIECTINRVNDIFFDQLEYADFYRHSPLEKITQLGIEKMRFPILWEKHQPHLEKEIDWSWTDKELISLKENGIDPIAGLVHHGSGPAFTSLLDPQFPYLLAAYARQVALRYPWINHYTPVNEPLTTARFSGLYGLWFPHHKNDTSFLLMLLHQLKGVVLSMQEIRKVNPEAKLVQTEDLGKTYSTPKLAYQANFENKRRWLTYDLLCGQVNEQHSLWRYFTKNNIPSDLLEFFQENPCTPDLFGFNYYITSERFLDEELEKYPRHTYGSNKRHEYVDVEAVRVSISEETGIKTLLAEAWSRYQKPLAITEVHLHCHREEQLRWFKYVWDSCNELKKDGVNIEAVTAWAIFGSFGWDKLLTLPKGNYESGVFDLRSGMPRPTALAAFIKNINASKIEHHLLLKKVGWWHRDSRLLYPKIFHQDTFLNDSTNLPYAPLLIIGKNGTLGKAFARLCNARAIPFVLLSRQECDITQHKSVRLALELYKPWAVVNAAGYVKVDEGESESQQCFDANEHGAINVAMECARLGIKMATFSTDLVFDGQKRTPYVESDTTNPLNIYGASKAFAEKALNDNNSSVLIIRTSAFFSSWDKYNFLHWVEQMLSEGNVVTVANDVIVSPTYVPDLVHATLDLLVDDERGLWHLANQGNTTWADLAFATAEKNNLNTDLIKAVSIEEMQLPAERPVYSVLGTEKGFLLPPLQHALTRYFEEKAINFISQPQAVLA